MSNNVLIISHLPSKDHIPVTGIKMITHTRGPTFLATRDIANMDIYAICNDLTDFITERKYEIVPEQITEGGILFKSWSGKKESEYKSMRLYLSSGNWPYLRDDDTMTAMYNRECIIAPKGTTINTFLKAMNGAPVWTIDEVNMFNTIFCDRGFKLEGKLPSKKSLCIKK